MTAIFLQLTFDGSQLQVTRIVLPNEICFHLRYTLDLASFDQLCLDYFTPFLGEISSDL